MSERKWSNDINVAMMYIWLVWAEAKKSSRLDQWAAVAPETYPAVLMLIPTSPLHVIQTREAFTPLLWRVA